MLPLLVTPELPDGIFEVYEMPAVGILLVHTKEGADGFIMSETETFRLTDNCKITVTDSQFMGVYASRREALADYPEYIL